MIRKKIFCHIYPDLIYILRIQLNGPQMALLVTVTVLNVRGKSHKFGQ